jgi:hypothetical protein
MSVKPILQAKPWVQPENTGGRRVMFAPFPAAIARLMTLWITRPASV